MVTVNIPYHEVTVSGKFVRLTPKEWEILAFLSKNGGRVVSRNDILTVWPEGQRGDVEPRTVDQHIARVRLKMGKHCPIETVNGYGYKAKGVKIID